MGAVAFEERAAGSAVRPGPYPSGRAAEVQRRRAWPLSEDKYISRGVGRRLRGRPIYARAAWRKICPRKTCPPGHDFATLNAFGLGKPTNLVNAALLWILSRFGPCPSLYISMIVLRIAVLVGKRRPTRLASDKTIKWSSNVLQAYSMARANGRKCQKHASGRGECFMKRDRGQQALELVR